MFHDQVSALMDVVTHQMEAFEDVRLDIGRKESDVRSLTVQGKELLAKAPPSTASSIQTRLESIQTEWQDLSKRASDRHALFQKSLDLAKRYRVAVDVFQPWIAKTVMTVDELKSPSFRKGENMEQLQEIQDIRSDIRAHSNDYEAVQQQGMALLGVCQADVESVQKEVGGFQKAWEDINDKTLKRARSLEDINHRLAEYEDAMIGLKVRTSSLFSNSEDC